MFDPSSVTAAILAGGLGKRLRSVISKQQKVLAKVHEKPFLQILLEQLDSSGFRQVVLCTGYLGHQIKRKFGSKFSKLSLTYSEEPFPLGTAGGLRFALPLLRSDHIMVMNGDSFCDVNLIDFGEFHFNRQANA